MELWLATSKKCTATRIPCIFTYKEPDAKIGRASENIALPGVAFKFQSRLLTYLLEASH